MFWSLTCFFSQKSEVLGDASFPNFISKKGSRSKITLFRDLFEKYSKLKLSFLTDKSVAIFGLEKRLVESFCTEGKHGILQCYLHRSILWHRSGKRMKRIDYPSDKKVPTWSWMAYEGGISYMEIEFSQVGWSNAVQWSSSEPDRLKAPVWEFQLCII